MPHRSGRDHWLGARVPIGATPPALGEVPPRRPAVSDQPSSRHRYPRDQMPKRRGHRRRSRRQITWAEPAALSRSHAGPHSALGEPLEQAVSSDSWPTIPDDSSAKPSLSRRRSRLPLVAFGLACAVTIVALAYAASRSGSPWATPVFWVGEALLYAVPAAMLLHRRPVTSAEGFGVSLFMPVATYLILEAYHPVQFLFLDELAHVRTAQAILATHHLFSSNPILTVSPQYPGLEIATTALVSLTRMSIYQAGTVVVGTAHVLVAVAIYLLVAELTLRPRVAALAVVIYATQPHFQFFDSYFIYEVIALPFLVSALLAVVKMLKQQNWAVGSAWGIVAVLCASVTVVSHHVTSYALVAFLLLMVLVLIVLRRGIQLDWRVVMVLAIAIGVTALWDLGVATATVAYFQPFVASLLATSIGHAGALHTTGPSGPLFDLGAEYASVLLLCCLAPIGVWRIWHLTDRPRRRLTQSVAVLSIGLAVALGLRLLGSQGAELYGRATTFVMIPLSLVAAFAIRPGKWQRKFRIRIGWSAKRVRWSAAGTIIIIILGVGGVAGGWPPAYARLPGPFLAEAWERSVDQHELDLANWAATRLPPDNGIASDFTTSSVLASIGHQAAPDNIASLFLSKGFVPSARAVVRQQAVTLIVVDKRLSDQLPADGSYFSDDPHAGAYRSPIPAGELSKFQSVSGLSQVFDDGTMSVYDVVGSLYTVHPPRS